MPKILELNNPANIFWLKTHTGEQDLLENEINIVSIFSTTSKNMKIAPAAPEKNSEEKLFVNLWLSSFIST